jgi:bisphosphoglycerate-independent phosphoglycerate mutase (AlkP superfamily)
MLRIPRAEPPNPPSNVHRPTYCSETAELDPSRWLADVDGFRKALTEFPSDRVVFTPGQRPMGIPYPRLLRTYNQGFALDQLVALQVELHKKLAGFETYLVRDSRGILEKIRELSPDGKTDETLPAIVDPRYRIPFLVHLGLMDFRTDRARQYTTALVHPQFGDFLRFAPPTPNGFAFVLPTPTVGPHMQSTVEEHAIEALPAILAKSNIPILFVSGSTKGDHVGPYFNGGDPNPPATTIRRIKSDPTVTSFAEDPEMSVWEITRLALATLGEKGPIDQVVEQGKVKPGTNGEHRKVAIGDQCVLVLNYPAVDQVGHSANHEATRRAAAAVDAELEKLTRGLFNDHNFDVVIIGADHGNGEDTSTPQHTTNLVLYSVLFKDSEFVAQVSLNEGCTLAGVTKAILELQAGVTPSEDMKESLFASIPDALKNRCQRVGLVIVDGLGQAPDEQSPHDATRGTMPFLDSIRRTCPTVPVEASGERLGLRPGQPGNSEVGHLTLGTGQTVEQSIVLIDRQIDPKRGAFYERSPFFRWMASARACGKPVHLLGLYSGRPGIPLNETNTSRAGGMTHSAAEHWIAAINTARDLGFERSDLVLHLFTDGRDSTYPAHEDIQGLLHHMNSVQTGVIGTAIGRIYKDRAENYFRTMALFNVLYFGLPVIDPLPSSAFPITT